MRKARTTYLIAKRVEQKPCIGKMHGWDSQRQQSGEQPVPSNLPLLGAEMF